MGLIMKVTHLCTTNALSFEIKLYFMVSCSFKALNSAKYLRIRYVYQTHECVCILKSHYEDWIFEDLLHLIKNRTKNPSQMRPNGD